MVRIFPTPKPLTSQLMLLARELLEEEKDLSDLQAWLATYPGRKRPYLCDAVEQAMLDEFQSLLGRPINIYQWQAFYQHLRDQR